LQLTTITNTEQIKALITEMYSGDSSLLEKWHVIAPTTLEKAVENSLNIFLDSPKLEFKLIENNGELIGYVGIEQTDIRYVKGFFIAKKHRNAEVKNGFIDLLKRELGEVIIPLNKNNLRAQRFFIDNCFDILIENEEYVVLYLPK